MYIILPILPGGEGIYVILHRNSFHEILHYRLLWQIYLSFILFYLATHVLLLLDDFLITKTAGISCRTLIGWCELQVGAGLLPIGYLEQLAARAWRAPAGSAEPPPLVQPRDTEHYKFSICSEKKVPDFTKSKCLPMSGLSDSQNTVKRKGQGHAGLLGNTLYLLYLIVLLKN